MRRRSDSVPCLQRKPLERQSTPTHSNNLQQKNKILQSSARNIPRLASRERRASVSGPCNSRPASAAVQSAFKTLKIQQPVKALRESLENLSRDLNLSLDTISMLSREEVYRRMEVEYEAMKKVDCPKTAIVSPFLVNAQKEEDDEVANLLDDSVFVSKSPSPHSKRQSLPSPRAPSPKNRIQYQRSVSVTAISSSTMVNMRKQRKTSMDLKYNAPLVTGRSALMKSNRPMSANPSIRE